MNPLAEKLNEQISVSNPHVLEMLSDYGQCIFFPSAGILAHTAEAKAEAEAETEETPEEEKAA